MSHFWGKLPINSGFHGNQIVGIGYMGKIVEHPFPVLGHIYLYLFCYLYGTRGDSVPQSLVLVHYCDCDYCDSCDSDYVASFSMKPN